MPRRGTGWPATYINQTGSGLRPIDEGYALAREAAHKALAHRSGLRAGARQPGLDRDELRRRPGGRGAAHAARAGSSSPPTPTLIGGAAALARSLGRMDTAIALGEYATSTATR